MRVNFRQGIINYQIPSFLRVNQNAVDLIVTDTPLLLTIASGPKDYLFIEEKTISKAWTSIIPHTHQWIYIDYNTRTGDRTFGTTRFEPVVSSIAPISPMSDQHWFDLTTTEMKVWTGSRWMPKVRIIVAMIMNGITPVSVSQKSPEFDGTQVGLNIPILAGTVLYNNQTGHALKDDLGKFLTTEDVFRTNNTNTSLLKFANTLIEVSATQPIAEYTIVKFADFGRIEPADAFTTTQNIPYGIIQEGVITDQTTLVIVAGVITNANWDWSSYGINTPLYCNETGQLTSTPVIPQQPFCAIIIDKHTILLTTPRQTTTSGNGGETLQLMTDSVYGIGRLSLPAISDIDPIVVGDNDPRLTNSVLKIGDTMTGPLILHDDPVDDLEAVTKQYVDNLPQSLSELTDVQLISPTIDQVLSYNGTEWTNTTITIDTTLPDIIVPGTATKVTYNSKGLITDASNITLSDIPSIPWSHIVSTPTTVLGYGILDVYTKTASDNRYLQQNQTITLTGDITGSGTTAITTSLNITIPISKGGTGQTTAIDAINALLPEQTGYTGRALVTDGTNASWEIQTSTIQPANTTDLGGVIIGDGLDVDMSGKISVNNIVSSGNFGVYGDCRSREHMLYGVSTTNAPVELLLGGIDQLIVSEYSSWGFDVMIVATRTDGTIENGTWKVLGNVSRELHTTSTLITPDLHTTVVVLDDLNWDVIIDTDITTGALRFTVIGGDCNIRWVAYVRTVEVGYFT